MRTVLVICEVKYWRDLREQLARAGVGFLGFDKKKPNRKEINELVAKADFVVMRNLNVAHHSVRFAKEAAKAADKPFWVGRNFGAARILELLAEKFPGEDFFISVTADRPQKKAVTGHKTAPAKKKAAQTWAKAAAGKKRAQPKQNSISQKTNNKSLKSQLSRVKLDDGDIDFAKLFVPRK